MRSVARILSAGFLGLSLLASGLAMGHANHGAPLNNEQAITKAREYTQIFVARPGLLKNLALDESWKDVSDVGIHKKSMRYFIVSLYNANQKKTLYMLLSSYGDFVSANFDGSFEGL